VRVGREFAAPSRSGARSGFAGELGEHLLHGDVDQAVGSCSPEAILTDRTT
jgi:hypothetical protein